MKSLLKSKKLMYDDLISVRDLLVFIMALKLLVKFYYRLKPESLEGIHEFLGEIFGFGEDGIENNRHITSPRERAIKKGYFRFKSLESISDIDNNFDLKELSYLDYVGSYLENRKYSNDGKFVYREIFGDYNLDNTNKLEDLTDNILVSVLGSNFGRDKTKEISSFNYSEVISILSFEYSKLDTGYINITPNSKSSGDISEMKVDFMDDLSRMYDAISTSNQVTRDNDSLEILVNGDRTILNNSGFNINYYGFAVEGVENNYVVDVKPEVFNDISRDLSITNYSFQIEIPVVPNRLIENDVKFEFSEDESLKIDPVHVDTVLYDDVFDKSITVTNVTLTRDNFEFSSMTINNVDINTTLDLSENYKDYMTERTVFLDAESDSSDFSIQPCLDIDFNPEKVGEGSYSLLGGGLELRISGSDIASSAVFGVRDSNRSDIGRNYETRGNELSALLFKAFEGKGVFLDFETNNGGIYLKDVNGTRMFIEDKEGVNVDGISYNIVVRKVDTGEELKNIMANSKLDSGNYVVDVIADVSGSSLSKNAISLYSVNRDRNVGRGIRAPEFTQLIDHDGKTIRAYALDEIGFRTDGKRTLLDQMVDATDSNGSVVELVTMDTVADNVIKGRSRTYINSISGAKDQYLKLHPNAQKEKIGLLYLVFDRNDKVLGELGYGEEGLEYVAREGLKIKPVIYELGADVKGSRSVRNAA